MSANFLPQTSILPFPLARKIYATNKKSDSLETSKDPVIRQNDFPISHVTSMLKTKEWRFVLVGWKQYPPGCDFMVECMSSVCEEVLDSTSAAWHMCICTCACTHGI